MASKNREKQDDPCRDRTGRFLPGHSGNPKGRPSGACCSALRQAQEWAAAEGVPMLIEQARGGDMDAVKTLVGLLPRQKPVSLPEPLPDGAGASSSAGLAEQARAVLAAALSGELGPDAAAGHMALLGQMTKIEENSELRARIEALERAINGGA